MSVSEKNAISLADLPACPVETTLTLISDKWKVLILRDLMPATKTFDICYATKNEAKLLHVKEHQALLLQKDVVYDQNQEPVHYTKMLINSERYQTTVSV